MKKGQILFNVFFGQAKLDGNLRAFVLLALHGQAQLLGLGFHTGLALRLSQKIRQSAGLLVGKDRAGV